MKKSACVSIFSKGGFIALITFLLPSILISNYYVAPTGNNSNSGAIESPWASILYAVGKAQPGDTVFVRGGTYAEGEIWIRQNYGMGGRDGMYVTIAAFPDEIPIFTNGSRGLIIDASYVRVIGLDFRNGKEMYNVNWAGPTHHIELIKNRFSGVPGYAAISISGDHNLIEKNVIELSGNSVGTQGHGIYVMEGAHTIIRGNFISGTSGYGIHLYERPYSNDPPGYVRGIRNILIEENFVAKSRERSGIIVAAEAGNVPVDIDSLVIRNNVVVNNPLHGIILIGWSEIKNIQIYHNTIYGNADNAIQIYEKVKNVIIKNNIICTKAGKKHIDNDPNAPNIIVERNLYYPAPIAVKNIKDINPVLGDPLFIDPDHNDFNLKKGSIAIDAGINLGLSFKGAAPDLGAFEFDPLTAIQLRAVDVPKLFHLQQNYPNPMRISAFNPITVINFNAPFDTYMDLSIFNLLGQHVRTLVRGQQAAGAKTVTWDGRDDRGVRATTGIYLYSLKLEGYSLTKKMVLLE